MMGATDLFLNGALMKRAIITDAWVFICFAVLLACATAPAVAANEDANTLFESFFGEQVKAVSKTRSHEDDLALVAEILEAAADVIDQPKVAAVFHAEAAKLAARHDEGHTLAISSWNTLAELQPKSATKWLNLVVTQERRRYASAGAQRKEFAGDLLQAMLKLGAAFEQEKDFKSASGQYRQAIPIARMISREEMDAVTNRIQLATQANRIQIQVARLQKTVEDEPTNKAALMELLGLLIGELDRPREALDLTLLIRDNKLANNIRLATLPLYQLKPDQALALAEWYRTFVKPTMNDVTKRRLFSRIHHYLQLNIDNPTQTDAGVNFAKLMMNVINTELERVGGLGESSLDIKRPNIMPEVVQLPKLAIPTEGLLLHYSFDDDTVSDTSVKDISGQGLHGTPFDVQVVPGAVGKAIRLDGNFNNKPSYVLLGDPEQLRFDGPFSVSVWVRPFRMGGPINILSKGRTDSPQAAVFLRLYKYHWSMGTWNGYEYSATKPVDMAQIGQWVHVVGMYDGSAWHLSLNGKEVSQNRRKGPVQVGAPWHLGSSTLNTRFFKGEIDELRIYNRALTKDEITSLSRESSLQPSSKMFVETPEILRAGEEMDALALVEPRLHAVRGDWVRNGKSISARGSNMGRIAVPLALSGSYEITAKVTRVRGTDNAGFLLPIGNSTATLHLDGWPNHGSASGVDGMNGKFILRNPKSQKGPVLTNGKVHDVQVTVMIESDTADISILVDKVEIFRDTAPVGKISRGAYWLIHPQLGLIAHNGEMRYDSVRIRMLAGGSARLMPPPLRVLGWQKNPANDHTYLLVSPTGWHVAHALAQQLGANLVTINDREENAWIAKTYSGMERIMTGFNDLDNEGTFTWSSGENSTFTNWLNNEPNNYNQSEHFASLVPPAAGRWFDVSAPPYDHNTYIPRYPLIELKHPASNEDVNNAIKLVQQAALDQLKNRITQVKPEGKRNIFEFDE